MKNFLLGIVYTVVVAGILVHFSGCEAPDLSEIKEMLTPAASVTAAPMPSDKNETGNGTETVTPTIEPDMTADDYGVTAADDYVWTTGSVNMRKGPSTDFDKLGVVSSGTKVHRTGICENGWIRIEHKDIIAFISGKYYTTENPSGEGSQTVSATPKTEVKATSVPKPTGAPTLTPAGKDKVTATPSPSRTPMINDDTSAVLASIPYVANDVNTDVDFYYDNEKDATAAFLKNASGCTLFSMLYKDKSCMHTPEYFMATYPELFSVEIDYEESQRFKNGVYVIFKTKMKEGGQYAYAIRTGNMAFLEETELQALKSIKKISDKLGLENMKDIDVIKTVHDYLINNTRYDTSKEAAKESHTPYGLITNNVAVCDGYAESFMIFMLLNDIECTTVTGIVKKEESEKPDQDNTELHAWNQLCLDGEWYNVDVTWDDPISTNSNGEYIDTLRYTYFLVNDKVMEETHTSDCGYDEKCSSDKYHMYMYKQYLCENDEDVWARIEEQKENDSIYFVYREERYDKGDMFIIFQKKYNVALRGIGPIEVRDGYMMFEIINPF